MLYEYLCSNYMPNEPIFVADVSLPVSNVNLRQMFKTLCDAGKIKRFDTGVYYLPKKSRLNGGVRWEQIQLPDINIYTEMEKLMDITRDIPLQINWELLLKFRIWWKLYQIMSVPGYGK